MDRFTHSSAPQRKVKALQFGVLDADFLVSRRMPLIAESSQPQWRNTSARYSDQATGFLRSSWLRPCAADAPPSWPPP